MHERTSAIQNKNGLELYRIIYNSVDALPANAEFIYDNQMMELGFAWRGKAPNLKDLYEFQVVFNKKVIRYNKTIGREPDHSKLRDILV